MKPLARTFVIFSLVFAFGTDGFTVQTEIKETVTKSFQISGNAPGVLTIDNISGSIEIRAHSGKSIEMTAYRTIFARHKEKIAEAREKMPLKMTQDGNSVTLFVDAPFRCEDGSINHRGWRHYGYEVTYDFEVKVPRRLRFSLKTVNDGEITVADVHGDFVLDNINGGIRARNLAGSGRIYALNGDVDVSFDENPGQDCYFGSLNGEVEVLFQPGLSADLRIKTFNGEVFSDFDVTYLPPRTAHQERKRGKYVYKSDKAFGARVGAGGPEFEFDGFNGDIFIKQK